MKKIRRALEWIIASSADANKLSLMIKGVLLGVLPVAVAFAGLVNVQLDSATLEKVVETISQIVLYGGGAISALVTAWGLVRKIITTANGTNDVVAGWHEEDGY
jgi:hypothetical protein